ncbi:MAG: DUF3052 domain-containing protein [Bifidobacteriaceae bacterium]|nr:DUF3052 domain-containing protein [Bifidobacteriaceae bacterium]
MGATAADLAGSFGFVSGQWVQELGYDDDVDFDLREAIEALTGTELVDEDWGDVTDGTIVWWRDGDGDLTDTLINALAILEEGGVVWVLTPKAGRSGYVAPGEIAMAASTAGLHATSSVSVAPEWAGTRLAARGRSAKGKA